MGQVLCPEIPEGLEYSFTISTCLSEDLSFISDDRQFPKNESIDVVKR
jgi:hypothetical protein